MSSLSAFLYRHSPYVLQNLAISLYGMRLRRLRYGRRYRETLARLLAADAWTAEQTTTYQNEQVARLVRKAITDVPYYRDRYRSRGVIPATFDTKTLSEWCEILDKKTVKEQSDSFRSEAFPARDLSTVFTSGTTGAPLRVTATRDSLAENFAFFSYFLRACGVDPFENSVTFAGRLIVPQDQQVPPYWRHNMAMRTWLFSSYHISATNIPAYLHQLEAVAPLYVDSYPSSVYAIAKYMIDHNLTLPAAPKAIVTSSETLTPEHRAAIEQAFRCKVFDQYGCAEMATFVYQCEAGSYHSHPMYGLVEILDDEGRACAPGETGDLVLTGFINDAMPLIRYRIGDRAVASNSACACGRKHPVIGAILGREDDYIVTPEGNMVGRLDPMFKGLTGILEAQVVQEAIDQITILVVPAAEFDDAARASLIEGLRERVGRSMKISVKDVPAIARTRGGKFRSVISRIPPQR